MKIQKTKQERHEEADAVSTTMISEVCEKVEKFGKVTLEFNREDFKDELSSYMGWGFQDMKKENRLLITELIRKYNLKFEPVMTDEGFGVNVHIKK